MLDFRKQFCIKNDNAIPKVNNSFLNFPQSNWNLFGNWTPNDTKQHFFMGNAFLKLI